MEVLSAIASWNLLGAFIAIAGILLFRKYRDIYQETGKVVTKQKTLCIAMFAIGIIYLLMPGWLNLIKIAMG